MIPYGRQEISEEDIESVVEVLRSDFITQGPVVPHFEQAVADYCGAGHGVAVNSGTSALHLACRALGVEEGDHVWTTPITFVASANCARYCGAEVDFVDIDPHTFNLSPDALAEKLEVAEREGRLPKVVIPVHFGGLPCDMAAIHELAQRYSFAVIEDASHAIGAYYRGEPVGNGRYSDITVFSFHPVKIITTAEGGMAVTNREDIAERMGLLRSHGITRDPALMSREPDGLWYYEQVELGYNYRMTELQAALGLSQLERLDGFIQARKEKAELYSGFLRDLPLRLPIETPGSDSAWHLYVVQLEAENPGQARREVFEDLRSRGWGVNVHYIPVPWQPEYARHRENPLEIPAAEAYYELALTIPLFPGLRHEQQKAFVDDLADSLGCSPVTGAG